MRGQTARPVELDDLSDADLLAVRNEAIVHGQQGLASEIDAAIEKRANPDLYRHSRRRK